MTLLPYWLRLARLSFHYRKKSSVLLYPPVRLWVEPTNCCNFQCLMCPNKLLKKEEKGFMRFELFKKIIDEAAGLVFEVSLAHRGEAFLHPQILDMIDYAKEKGLFTRLHTNGSLLSEEMARKILSVGLDRLSFSFDGYDKKTYENIRRGGNFDHTVSNITHFLELKKRIDAKKPAAVVEIINFNQGKGPNHFSSKKSLLALFHNLHPKDLIIKNMHNWAGELEIDAHRKRFSLCPFPWNALVIFWNGDVLGCTQDFFGSYVLGNVKDSSLQDIWNGERIVILRRSLANHRTDNLPACSGCDRLRRKTFLGVPQEYLFKYITRKMN